MLIRADVLVENFRAGVMDKLGYSWDWLKERYPQLIFASISGFGQTGPYSNRPAYDMVVQAMGGIMSVTGEQGGLPARIGASIDLGAGLYATDRHTVCPDPARQHRRGTASGCVHA